MLRPLIVTLTAVRLAARFPFKVAAVMLEHRTREIEGLHAGERADVERPAAVGCTESRARLRETCRAVSPLLSDVADVEAGDGRARVVGEPTRQTSAGVTLPDPNVPNARSVLPCPRRSCRRCRRCSAIRCRRCSCRRSLRSCRSRRAPSPGAARSTHRPSRACRSSVCRPCRSRSNWQEASRAECEQRRDRQAGGRGADAQHHRASTAS